MICAGCPASLDNMVACCLMCSEMVRVIYAQSFEQQRANVRLVKLWRCSSQIQTVFSHCSAAAGGGAQKSPSDVLLD